MQRRNLFRKTQKLPSTYPEVLMHHEMDFEKGTINVDLIRKLLYLYSIAIEFYDSVSKTEHHKFYMNKLNNLLANESVVKYLDEIKQDSTANKQTHLELFKGEETYKRSNSNPKNVDFHVLETLEDQDQNQRLMTRNYSIKHIKKAHKILFEDNQEKYKDEVKNFDKKMDKIESNIKVEIDSQSKNFEEIKKKKLERISSRKIIDKKRASKRESKILSFENINIDDMIYKEKIMKEIQEKNESMMTKEIEEYIEESMKKMYAEMEEIKLSYEDSIKEAIENNYEPIVEGLKQDLENDLSNLKASYDEEREREVEKIRLKYMNI